MKLLSFLFFALLALVMGGKLRKTKCVALGGDCDFTSYCCGDYQCRDYRCALKNTKENQVQWSPEGTKCDWFHHCKKNYTRITTADRYALMCYAYGEKPYKTTEDMRIIEITTEIEKTPQNG